MSDVVLHLPLELDKKLKTAAQKEEKDLEALILEVLERYLEEPSHDFIGAWSDSDITAEDIIAARTLGRDVELER